MERIMRIFGAPARAQRGELALETGKVSALAGSAARTRFVVDQRRLRAVKVAPATSGETKAEIHIIEIYCKTIRIHAPDCNEFTAVDHQTRCCHRGYRAAFVMPGRKFA
jgi:hypothetical protein